jgi:membrane-bound lytic murein transglycosylase D
MPSAALLARAASGSSTGDAVVATFEETPNEEPVVHRVRAGESLYAIAKKYGTTVEQLKSINRLTGNTLKIGARLVVSSPRTSNVQQQ